jgi:hypothetical protein
MGWLGHAGLVASYQENKVEQMTLQKLISPWMILLLLIGIVGAGLRAWQYWYFPVAGETQDEVAWTFLGAGLIQTGQPVSWSYFQGYEVIKTIEYQGANFPLVKPALDHPPLFSFLPGSVHTLWGNNWDSLPSIKQIRLPMVILSVLNLGLFIWWVVRTSSQRVFQLVAVVLAATVPSIVFLSRLVVSENLLVTWLLLILLFSTTRLEGWQKYAWVAIHACLPLTKISGLAIWGGSLVANWLERNSRVRKLTVLGGLLGIGLLFIYVALFDWSLFWQVQTQQAQRNSGLLTLFSTWWWEPSLVEKVFGDIWNQIGLMAMLLLAWQQTLGKRNRMKTLVILLFIAQLAFLLLSTGEQTIHGWYRIVFWPLWVYTIAVLVDQAWQQRQYWALGIAWLLLAPVLRLGMVYSFGAGFFPWQANISKAWLGLAGLAIMTVFLPEKLRQQSQKHLWITLGIIIVIAHMTTITMITHELFWQDALYLQTGIRP